MEPFHHRQQQDRRMLGQTIAAGGGDHHPWCHSSSPPQPPPPPPPAGYYNHLPHPPLPPPHQQHSYHYHHHPLPHPPQPQQAMAPPPYPQPHHSQYPPLPPRPHHPIPPPSAYPPPPNQAWGNPSWTQHQGWEYQEQRLPNSNEEDWAARAKAWAAAEAGTENHHTTSHFQSVGRIDDHRYTYHDQYQLPSGSAHDVQQPPFPQSSNQQLTVGSVDPLKQVNYMHGSTSIGPGPTSYGTGYDAGDGTTNRNADHIASPQKNYGPSSSIYEQEVSYSYSSAPGNRESVHQSELHIPLPLPQEGHHSQSTLPVQMIPTEQAHYPHQGQPVNFLPARDQPLDFERRHDSGHASYQKINYGHAGINHDPISSSIHAWTPTAPGFDPTFIPQPAIPVQHSPVLGGIPATGFLPSVPPVSSSYGLGLGASHLPAFTGDPNAALNLLERPKKAAVPNWLREEIIKNKSVLPSAVTPQSTGNSFHSVGSEDGDESLRRADQGDSKSIDSTRSTENEDDDEEDVEAARTAAINQQIKRVLTEVLLKVTDELFDEIATKVIYEDEQTVGEAEESTVNGNQKVSPPTAIPAPKASAKVLVPIKMETNKVDGVGENSSTTSPGANILGLGNYASDDDEGDDEIQSSKLLFYEKNESAPPQQDSDVKPSENNVKRMKDKADIDGVAQKNGSGPRAEEYTVKNGSPSVDNLNHPDKSFEMVSVATEEPTPVSNKVEEPPESVISSRSNETVGAKNDRGKEFTSRHSKSDKPLRNDSRDSELKSEVCTDKNSQKTTHETSHASDSTIHEDRNKVKDKMDKRNNLKERTDNKSSERGSNVKEADSKSSKYRSTKDDRKEETKDKREKYKEDSERKRERARDEKDGGERKRERARDKKEDGERKRERARHEKEDGEGKRERVRDEKEDGEKKRERNQDDKEDRTTPTMKDPLRYTSRRSPSPRGRGKNSKVNSISHGSASGDEPSDNSKKRKKQSSSSSLSPSPTKSRKRRDSRSPHSKNSHHKHSPYSSTGKRRRSRSISPAHRRSAAHKRGS